MSQQEPAFYNLEFSSDASFWEGAGDSQRRTFLMPLPDPAEFLVFGVVDPSSKVLFVARGRVRDHLGEFVSRMTRDGASVEFYARPPLPWQLVKRYIKDDPYEHQETDGPRNPPEQGIAAYGGGADEKHALLIQEATINLPSDPVAWPPAQGCSRRVIVMPGSDVSEFLAFGVCDNPDRFVFAARGATADKAAFLLRMAQDGATVEHHEVVPPELPYVQAWLDEHFPTLSSLTRLRFSTRELTPQQVG
ncbi:hypothetical protein [Pyxidicoccus xibeiensis]|uniref:hypothetical protein n=1 Tax=Pyxidicoccus xibeiensis TaxID=2906759 RepID=UPI0020A702A8|nr:hypothetical protein [Pyxidicoccus xibeiensis]MCP3138994.1 hypothetical protein [Pyxidicoccus xibeiensis]